MGSELFRGMTGSRMVNRRQIDSQKNHLCLQRKSRANSIRFFISKFGAEQYWDRAFFENSIISLFGGRIKTRQSWPANRSISAGLLSKNPVRRKKRCQEPFLCFLGLPWGRRVLSRPRRATTFDDHFSSPSGQPRFTLFRIALSSDSLCGSLT